MHFTDDTALFDSLENAKSVEAYLKVINGSYNKTNLDAKQFDCYKVVQACQVAYLRDKKIDGGDNPEKATSRVYQIWHSIIEKSARSQLHPSLQQYALSLQQQKINLNI